VIAPRHVPRPAWPVLLLTGAGVLTCVALSGSRGTVLQCGLTLVAAAAVALLGRGGGLKARAALLPVAVAAVSILLYPLVFPEGFEAFAGRWSAADAAETRNFSTGVFGRALYGLVDFVRLIETVPLLGYGLGYGGNASIIMKATVDGVMPGRLVETDFARHMVDLGPLFGMLFIALRLALAGRLSLQTLRVTRQVPDPVPMLLFSFAAYVLVLGQVTGQGTITFYGWFTAGLLMAAIRNPHFPPQPRRTNAVPRRQPV
jgi:hypothetical protein